MYHTRQDARENTVATRDSTSTASVPIVSCLQTMFEAQVDLGPERIAVTSAGQHLTYGALDALANQLAWKLRALGVRTEVPVAIGLDPGIDFVVAVLAVLKAGGTYVPIDLQHPAERVRFYLEDSHAAVLITQRKLSGAIASCVPEVLLDLNGGQTDAAMATRPSAAGSSSDRAYVIYTSGSTGKPKGVEITHANVVRLFAVTQPLFGFDETDTWTLCHSVAFDFSVWELFGPLLHGGRVVIASREVVREPRQLAALIKSEGVTMLSQTPSAFRQLAPELLKLDALAYLRWVVFGGEALDPAILRPWIARYGDKRPALINMYGITETTVHATYRRIHAVDVFQGRGSPIGRPLPDLEFMLLDPQRKPVAEGEVGEIYVVGPGVARGYLDREALTAERFVELPDGRRAYRSGDLARWLPAWQLEFIGRVDDQVKVRGYRIEPGEIESVLREFPEVGDAAVLFRGQGESTALLAYVVPREGGSLSTQRLREELTRRLPPHMMPSAIMVLDRLPLTLNGKLDRAALPAPTHERAAFREPASAAEAALCRHVALALGLDHVGLDDRFLTLGGHSLQAAQVARALAEELGRSVDVAGLLSNSTLAELAAQLVPRPSPGRILASAGSQEVEEVHASAAQLGLWLHAQRHPADTAYHETLTLPINGSIDATQLAAYLSSVIRRHASLRAGFQWRAGKLWQQVSEPRPVQLVVEDLRTLPPELRPHRALLLAEAQARVPFDLAVPPLLRALLVTLDEREHRLYVTVHHIVCDAFSLYNLAAEISALHLAHAQGWEPRLPALPASYAALLASADEAHAIESAAARPPGKPLLAAVRPAGALLGEKALGGARRIVRLDPKLAGALRAVAASEGATLFMVLLATWHALLYRYGADDAVVGIAVDRRTCSELLPLIGPLFSVRPVAAHPRADAPFTALLAEIRAAVAGALRTVPKDPQRAEDSPWRGGSFETVLGLVPAPLRRPGISEARVLEVDNGGAKYDLSMLLQEQADGGLSGILEHRTALWSAEFADRMVRHFQMLLASVAADPRQELRALDLLGADERRQILDWRQGSASAPTSRTTGPGIHELFLAQARQRPEAIAIESGQRSLTYRQLADRAAAIAARLRTLGVSADCLVAVCLDSSSDLVAALLGTLMAGGAYLPFDTAQPAGRIAQVLADARPAAVLTSANLRGRFPQRGIPILSLDEEFLAKPNPAAEGWAEVHPAQLAYVIYTSGSTGQPKGVAIEHRSASSFVAAWTRLLGLCPTDRVLQYSRISFDASIDDVFVTLAAGATLVLSEVSTPLIGAELAAVLAERAITKVQLPPSVLSTLPSCELPALRTLVAAAEACPAEAVERWAPGRQFFNGYGPTETTVIATVARCQPGQGRPPIGRPLDYAEVYVLGAERELMPCGIPGELYIGGAGVARGYLGQPELTALRFVDNPLVPGERLYRTGDRVRWRSDGQLEFLGRIDRQIKLRGFRIEPGEIEAVLRQHPSVRDAVVMVREDIAGHSSLCAYVTGRVNGQLSIAEVRQFACDRLADYMVPAALIDLPELPLTANGKVDLARLPAPRAFREVPSVDELSADGLEARVAAVWAELLGIAKIGHNESFFYLGGTSLLLVKAQERLEKALGRTLPISVLFQHPTPRALAQYLRAATEADDSDEGARADRLRRALRARPQLPRRTTHE